MTIKKNVDDDPEVMDDSFSENELDTDDLGSLMGESHEDNTARGFGKHMVSEGKNGMLEGGVEQLKDDFYHTYRAYEDVTGFVTDGKAAYGEVMKELRPTINSLKQSALKILPMTKQLMPGGVYDKLYKKLESSIVNDDSESAEQREEDSRNAAIQAALDIFQQSGGTPGGGISSADAVGQATMATQMTQQAAANNQLIAHANWQTNFLKHTYIPYLQKDLEIKYRMMFSLKDLVSAAKVSVNILDEKLSQISVNTALTEVQKQRANKDLINQISGRTMSSARRYLSGFSKKLFGNLKRKVLNSVTGGLDSIALAADMLGGMDPEMMGGMNPFSPKSLAGMAAGWVGKKIGAKASSKLVEKLRPLHTLIETGFKGFQDRMIMKALRFRRDNIGKGGWRGFLSDIIEPWNSKATVGNMTYENSDEAASFDRLTHDTITTVIPELLAKQLSQITDIHSHLLRQSGMSEKDISNVHRKSSTGELKYDWEKRQFSTRSKLYNKIQLDAFGDTDSQSKMMASVVKNISGALQINGKDTDAAKAVTANLIPKMLMNMAREAPYVDINLFRKVIAGAELNSSDNLYYSQVFRGINEDDARAISSVMVDMAYPNGRELDRKALYDLEASLSQIRIGIEQSYRKADKLGYGSIIAEDLDEDYTVSESLIDKNLNKYDPKLMMQYAEPMAKSYASDLQKNRKDLSDLARDYGVNAMLDMENLSKMNYNPSQLMAQHGLMGGVVGLGARAFGSMYTGSQAEGTLGDKVKAGWGSFTGLSGYTYKQVVEATAAAMYSDDSRMNKLDPKTRELAEKMQKNGSLFSEGLHVTAEQIKSAKGETVDALKTAFNKMEVEGNVLERNVAKLGRKAATETMKGFNYIQNTEIYKSAEEQFKKYTGEAKKLLGKGYQVVFTSSAYDSIRAKAAAKGLIPYDSKGNDVVVDLLANLMSRGVINQDGQVVKSDDAGAVFLEENGLIAGDGTVIKPVEAKTPEEQKIAEGRDTVTSQTTITQAAGSPDVKTPEEAQAADYEFVGPVRQGHLRRLSGWLRSRGKKQQDVASVQQLRQDAVQQAEAEFVGPVMPEQGQQQLTVKPRKPGLLGRLKGFFTKNSTAASEDRTAAATASSPLPAAGSGFENIFLDYYEYRKGADAALLTAVKRIRTGLGAVLQGLFTGAGTAVSGISRMFGSLASGAYRGIGAAAGGLFRGLGTVGSGLGHVAGSMLDIGLAGGSSIANLLKTAVTKGGKVAWKGAKLPFKGLNWLLNDAGGAITRPIRATWAKMMAPKFVDIYRKDEIDPKKGPLLTAKRQRDKECFYASGKIVERSEDIHEPVYVKGADGKPETVISKEDVEHGLVNVDNIPLNSLTRYVVSGQGALTSTLVGGAAGLFKGVFKGLGKLGGAYVDVAKELFSLGASGAKGVGTLAGRLLGLNQNMQPVLDKMDIMISYLRAIHTGGTVKIGTSYDKKTEADTGAPDSSPEAQKQQAAEAKALDERAAEELKGRHRNAFGQMMDKFHGTKIGRFASKYKLGALATSGLGGGLSYMLGINPLIGMAAGGMLSGLASRGINKLGWSCGEDAPSVLPSGDTDPLASALENYLNSVSKYGHSDNRTSEAKEQYAHITDKLHIETGPQLAAHLKECGREDLVGPMKALLARSSNIYDIQAHNELVQQHIDEQDDDVEDPFEEAGVQRFARGGYVKGRKKKNSRAARKEMRDRLGGLDTIKARLTPGELVLNKPQQSRIAKLVQAVTGVSLNPRDLWHMASGRSLKSAAGEKTLDAEEAKLKTKLSGNQIKVKPDFVDVYRRDRIEPGKPLMTAAQQRAGVFDTVRKERLRKTAEIKGPVVDLTTKQTLITEEDLKIGLCDINGRRVIPTTFQKIFGFIASPMQSIKNFTMDKLRKWGKKGAISVLNRMGKFGKTIKSMAGWDDEDNAVPVKVVNADGSDGEGGLLDTATDLLDGKGVKGRGTKWRKLQAIMKRGGRSKAGRLLRTAGGSIKGTTKFLIGKPLSLAGKVLGSGDRLLKAVAPKLLSTGGSALSKVGRGLKAWSGLSKPLLTAGGAAASKLGSLGLAGGSKLLGLAGPALGALAKFAGPIGLALTAGKGIYDGVKGWQNAGQNLGMSEDQLGVGEKTSSAIGSALSGLTFGLVGKDTASKGVNWLSKKVGLSTDLTPEEFNELTARANAGDKIAQQKLKEAKGGFGKMAGRLAPWALGGPVTAAAWYGGKWLAKKAGFFSGKSKSELMELEERAKNGDIQAKQELAAEKRKGFMTGLRNITGWNLAFGNDDKPMSETEIKKATDMFQSKIKKGNKTAAQVFEKFQKAVNEGEWAQARRLSDTKSRGVLGSIFADSKGNVRWNRIIGATVGMLGGPAGVLLGLGISTLIDGKDPNAPMSESEVKEEIKRLQELEQKGNKAAGKVLEQFQEAVTEQNWKKARKLVSKEAKSGLQKWGSAISSTAKWTARIATLGLSMLFETSNARPMTEAEVKKFTDKMQHFINKGDATARRKLDAFNEAIAKNNWERARAISKTEHHSAIVRGIKASWDWLVGSDDKELTAEEIKQFQEKMQRKARLGDAKASRILDKFNDAVGAQNWKKARAISGMKDLGVSATIDKAVCSATKWTASWLFGGDGHPMSDAEIEKVQQDLQTAIDKGDKSAQRKLDAFMDAVGDEKWKKARQIANMPYKNALTRAGKGLVNLFVKGWMGDASAELSDDEIEQVKEELQQRISDGDKSAAKVLKEFEAAVMAEDWKKARQLGNLKNKGGVLNAYKSIWDTLVRNKDRESCLELRDELDNKSLDDETGTIVQGLQQFDAMVRRRQYNDAYTFGKDLLKLSPHELSKKHGLNTEALKQITEEGNALVNKINQRKSEAILRSDFVKSDQLNLLRSETTSSPDRWGREFFDEQKSKLADITGIEEDSGKKQANNEIVIDESITDPAERARAYLEAAGVPVDQENPVTVLQQAQAKAAAQPKVADEAVTNAAVKLADPESLMADIAKAGIVKPMGNNPAGNAVPVAPEATSEQSQPAVPEAGSTTPPPAVKIAKATPQKSQAPKATDAMMQAAASMQQYIQFQQQQAAEAKKAAEAASSNQQPATPTVNPNSGIESLLDKLLKSNETGMQVQTSLMQSMMQALTAVVQLTASNQVANVNPPIDVRKSVPKFS